jgi:two-component system, sensor histidine kinase and response regulator
MRLISRCKYCGKKYRINANEIRSQYMKFHCIACQNETILKNPFFKKRSSHLQDATENAPYNIGPDSYNADRRKTSLTPFWSSIRIKIILVLVVLALVSLSIVGWVASSHSRTALTEQAEKALKVYAGQKVKQYTLSFSRIQSEVDSAAAYARYLYTEENIPLQNKLKYENFILMPWTGKAYGSPELKTRLQSEMILTQNMVPVLKSIVTNDPLVQNAYLGTNTQIMIMDKKEDIAAIKKRKGYNNTIRPWFTKAVKEGETIWSKVYVDASTSELIVTCASPVYLQRRRLMGVVGFDIMLKTIQEDILALNIGYDSNAFLVDGYGKALVRSDMDKANVRWDKTYKTKDLLHTDNLAYNNIISNMTSGHRGVQTYPSKKGDKLVAYAPLPAIGASMGIVVSKDEVIRPALVTQRLIMVVWLAVLVVTVLVGLFMGNGITKPINSLTEVADRISHGEMNLKMLTEKRKDEIGHLTQAFNRLITSLKIAMYRLPQTKAPNMKISSD